MTFISGLSRLTHFHGKSSPVEYSPQIFEENFPIDSQLLTKFDTEILTFFLKQLEFKMMSIVYPTMFTRLLHGYPDQAKQTRPKWQLRQNNISSERQPMVW